jgi:hypothetical protein
VLSYAIMVDYFPVAIAARANGALSLPHFGWAFIVQHGVGVILGHWAPEDGHYPVLAYQTAFSIMLALQAIALAWFATPWLRRLGKHLRLSFVREDFARNNEAIYAAVPAESSLLEVQKQIEW